VLDVVHHVAMLWHSLQPFCLSRFTQSRENDTLILTNI
jgi:hypothetical protein